MLAQGLYYNQPRQGAPEYVIGGLSIQRDQFQSWLTQQETDEKGYLKLDILTSREGKPYIKLNDWKPNQK